MRTLDELVAAVLLAATDRLTESPSDPSVHGIATSIRGSLHLQEAVDADLRSLGSCVRHARCPWCWEDYHDALSAAYRVVLEASEEDVAALRNVDV